MKVVLFNNLSEVADVTEEGVAVTKDGGKLVTFSVDGTSEMACIARVMSTLVELVPEVHKDTTLYMYYGTKTVGANYAKFSTVVGITGVMDLDVKIRELMAGTEEKEAVLPVHPSEEAPVTVENNDNPMEEDAQIVP